MDPHMSSIMLAIAQIFGGLASAPLADTVGRRLLMIFSFLGSAIGLFVLSLYLYLNQNGYDLTQYSFIPVASLSFIMFIASAGVLSLFSVCFVESFSKKVKLFKLQFFFKAKKRKRSSENNKYFCNLFPGQNSRIDNMHTIFVHLWIYIR